MISIIIPTYNEVNLIVKTILHLNTLKVEASFEIIVSDGESVSSQDFEGY